MKIKVTDKSYAEVAALPSAKHEKPIKPNIFWRSLLKLVSVPALLNSRFTYEKIGMEKLPKNQPALYLMNHSSFIDMEIAVSLLYPRPFNIITTSDAFIGMDWLMRRIGCVPTNKFTADTSLIRDMMHIVKKQKSSIVLYPEASYSFDGTTTTLPDSTGKLIKLLKIPVVMIKTSGAFHHDPLYNGIQLRRVPVSAKMTYILSAEQIASMSDEEINEIVAKNFEYDHFSWQKENKIKVSEPFRADYLERVLYKCPHCAAEGKMVGRGITLTCESCGKSYTLDEYGYLVAGGGEGKFDHIPDWYRWERERVKEEIERGDYLLDCDVDIMITKDTKKLYRVGEGRLRHDINGFALDGCGGQLHYEHKPLCSHSLYSDFNWYEIADVICIGNSEYMYYCFPKSKDVSVAKTRLAAEEIYKLRRRDKEAACACK